MAAATLTFPELPTDAPSFELSGADGLRVRTFRRESFVRVVAERAARVAWDVLLRRDVGLEAQGFEVTPGAAFGWSLSDSTDTDCFSTLDDVDDWLFRWQHAASWPTDARKLVQEEMDRCIAAGVALLDPASKALAMRVPVTTLRLEAYRLFVADSSGRIAQLLDTAPGVLLLLITLYWRGAFAMEAVSRFTEAIVRGDELRGATMILLDALYDPRFALDFSARVGRPNAYEQLFLEEMQRASASHEIRRAAQLRHRLMLRNMRTLIEYSVSLLTPPPVFVPEDVPADPEQNARWFKTFLEAQRIGRRIVEAEARLGFLSFVGRNALALGELEAAKETMEALVTRIVVEGCRVTRQSSLPRVLEALAGVKATDERKEREKRARPFPALMEPFRRHGLLVVPLGTGEELETEGQRMRHCVGDYVDEALSGESLLFAAHLPFSRLTVEVRRTGEKTVGFCIGEIKGEANRDPSLEELALLAPWFRYASEVLNAQAR